MSALGSVFAGLARGGARRGAVVAGVVAAFARLGVAAAQPPAAPSHALPRVAIAEIGELTVAKTLGELGPDVVVKAAAQGARDACLDPATGHFRAPNACERPAVSAPVGVCMDTNLAEALTAMAPCTDGDLAVTVVELTSAGCRTTECLKSDARTAGATHLLVIQGKSSEFGLDAAADLIDLASGTVSSKRYRDYFPPAEREDAAIVPRTGPQVLAIIHGMTRDLVTAALGPVFLRGAGKAGAPAISTAGGLALEAHPPSARPHWPGWTLLGGGVAIAAAGAVLWAIDGNNKGCSGLGPGDLCHDLWDTKAGGISMVVGGALVAGAGVWFLLSSAGGRELALSPTGNGFIVRGRF